MRAWFARWTRDEQSIVVLFGCHALYMALVLAWEIAKSEPARYDATGSWVLLFTLAWACCVGYHARPISPAWWKWSGITLIAAYASRAVLLILAAFGQGAVSPGVLVAIGAWVTFATAVALIWLRFLTPWAAADVA